MRRAGELGQAFDGGYPVPAGELPLPEPRKEAIDDEPRSTVDWMEIVWEPLEGFESGPWLCDAINDETSVRKGLRNVTKRATPEVLGHFDGALPPGFADQFDVEVATVLRRKRGAERVIEGKHGPS